MYQVPWDLWSNSDFCQCSCWKNGWVMVIFLSLVFRGGEWFCSFFTSLQTISNKFRSSLGIPAPLWSVFGFLTKIRLKTVLIIYTSASFNNISSVRNVFRLRDTRQYILHYKFTPHSHPEFILFPAIFRREMSGPFLYHFRFGKILGTVVPRHDSSTALSLNCQLNFIFLVFCFRFDGSICA